MSIYLDVWKLLMIIFIQQSENLNDAISAHFNFVNHHRYRHDRHDHVTCWTNENQAIGQQFDSWQ